MSNKKFNAILAKNEIARQMKNYQQDGVSIDRIMACLNDIEQVIGTANQPSVEDIWESNSDI